MFILLKNKWVFYNYIMSYYNLIKTHYTSINHIEKYCSCELKHLIRASIVFNFYLLPKRYHKHNLFDLNALY